MYWNGITILISIKSFVIAAVTELYAVYDKSKQYLAIVQFSLWFSNLKCFVGGN